MLKSILFTYINLFSNILVALPKDQVMLFIGSHGGGCCLSPENKVRCLCWWLPQQIPDTTHFWLQENTFILRKGKKYRSRLLGLALLPCAQILYQATFMDMWTVTPDLKGYKRAGLALMFAKIQDPLETSHLS